MCVFFFPNPYVWSLRIMLAGFLLALFFFFRFPCLYCRWLTYQQSTYSYTQSYTHKVLFYSANTPRLIISCGFFFYSKRDLSGSNTIF